MKTTILALLGTLVLTACEVPRGIEEARAAEEPSFPFVANENDVYRCNGSIGGSPALFLLTIKEDGSVTEQIGSILIMNGTYQIDESDGLTLNFHFPSAPHPDQHWMEDIVLNSNGVIQSANLRVDTIYTPLACVLQ